MSEEITAIWRNAWRGDVGHVWIPDEGGEWWNPVCGSFPDLKKSDLRKTYSRKCKRCSAVVEKKYGGYVTP